MCTTVSLPHKTMPTAIWRLSLIENATICASPKYPIIVDKENGGADMQKEEAVDFKFKLRRWMSSSAIYS